jgi:hypothetical protein
MADTDIHWFEIYMLMRIIVNQTDIMFARPQCNKRTAFLATRAFLYASSSETMVSR